MSTGSASKIFENYTNLPMRVPAVIWIGLRALVLMATASMIVLLMYAPDLGIKIFWGLAIPVLPALFIVAPGLWRQICPMAALNQIPRAAGFSLAHDLPQTLQNVAFAIAVFSFVAFVGLRVPIFNHDAFWLAIGLVALLALAFVGGIAFKGRSGWCGTFCPLGPIQRFYGHAPIVLVRNGYCPSCVGCQKNCYDFSPAATIFNDLNDEDPTWTGQHRFFMAMMPGLLCGYFLQGPNPPYGEPLHAVIFVAAALASTGVYQAVITFFGVNPFRMANIFAGLSLVIFYTFAGPILMNTLGQLTGIQFPVGTVDISRGFGALLALAVYMQGRQNESVYRKAMREGETRQSTSLSRSDKTVGSVAVDGQEVIDRSSGISFLATPDQSLLEAMEAANVNINFGCRSGVCGADPVAICEGHENLSAADDNELSTLRRLGLQGKARLACACRVAGPVVIDRDLSNAVAFEPLETDVPQIDLAALGIRRVVIIGNGAAGVGVAEALRRVSQNVEIIIIADEFHHFYNRMAIGRVVYGRTAMDGLQLLPEAWYGENKVEVWRNTVVRSIARRAKLVRLATGDSLSYDRLVLAMGAKAATPTPNYTTYPNAFVLRSAADAQAIRAYIQSRGARRAVVIGGGVLGIEAADALHHLGLEITILQRAHRLMDRQLDATGAAILAEYLADIHINVETGVTVEGLEGGSVLEALRLGGGRTIEGDLFVACTGIVANADLARECGLEVGRGVKVDASMRTTKDPSIFAVGDVAEPKHGVSGLWTIAAAQAKTAVAAMIGDSEVFEPSRLLVQLKCDWIDLRSFGEVEAQPDDEIIEAPPHQEAWWRLVLREGALAGAVYVGPPGSSRDFTRVVQAGTDITSILDDLRAGHLRALRSLLVGPRKAQQPAASAASAKDRRLISVSEPESTIVPSLMPASSDGRHASEVEPRDRAKTGRVKWLAPLAVLLLVAGGYAAFVGLHVAQGPASIAGVSLPDKTNAPARLPRSSDGAKPNAAFSIPALHPQSQPSGQNPEVHHATVKSAVQPTIAPALPRVERPLDHADLPRRQQLQTDGTPSNKAPVYERGQELAKSGNFKEAIKYFDKAIQQDPTHAEAFNNRCWVYAIVGDLQAALHDCNQALRLKPRYADAFDSRGLVDLKIGQPVKAIADYDHALQLNPTQASSLYGRGIAKLRIGDKAGGNADIVAAEAINHDIAYEFTKYGIRRK